MWDGENRLSKVVQPDGTSETSEYSHEGLRRKKSVTSPSSVTTTTHFVWDGQSPVQERNENNLLLAQYTWGPETWDGMWSGGDLMDVLLLERRASTPGDKEWIYNCSRLEFNAMKQTKYFYKNIWQTWSENKGIETHD